MRRVWSWHPAQWYTGKSQHQLWYVTASLVLSSLKTGRLIFIWPPGSLRGHWPWCGCLELSNPSDIDATDQEVDAELLSLLNPWSDKSKVGLPITQCLWPQSQPHCGTWPHSWCSGQGPSLGTSQHSAAARKFAGHGDKTWLWKLNSVEAGGVEWGQPGPLGLMCPSVIAWEINHWPSPWLTGLALSWTCLPT